MPSPVMNTAVSADQVEAGARLAVLLAGAWRPDPPPFPEEADLGHALQCARRRGVAPLAVRKGQGAGAGGPALEDMAEECRAEGRRTFRVQAEVQAVLGRLRACGIEPVLGAGCALARRYPEGVARPAADLVLYLSREQAWCAVPLLQDLAARGWVRLYCPESQWGEATMAELQARAVSVVWGEVSVRCLGAEDQLRLHGLDFVREGGRMPLWLCDVGAMLETLPAGFDWDLCLRGKPRLTAAVRAVLGLAARLLGADLRAVPDREQVARRAPWLDRVILAEWGREPPGE